jgi:hypothetical protein
MIKGFLMIEQEFLKLLSAEISEMLCPHSLVLVNQ